MGKKTKKEDINSPEEDEEEEQNENKSLEEKENEEEEEEDPSMLMAKEIEEDHIFEEERIQEEKEKEEKEKQEEEKEKEEKDNNEEKMEIENKNPEEEENDNKPILLKSKKKTLLKSIPKPKPIEPWDPDFNLEERYFYQEIKQSEWDEIKNFLNDYLSTNKTDLPTLENFFNNYPNMYKGSDNTDKLKEMINNIAKTYQNNFTSYQTLINFFINTYLNTKPALLECYFFPNQNNERKVVDMFRTCKKTLDLAIFTLTKDSISNAIEEAHKRGVKVRLIADDSCSLMLGSDVRKLAAMGVPTKTDKAKYYMHNKVAIIDKSVLVTGSYNWSRQATNYNQENILFFENKELCEKYTEEYDKLWEQFEFVSQSDAQKWVDESESKTKAEKEKREKEKAKKEKEKEKEKAKKEKEKEKAKKEKEKEKAKKDKEKEKAKKEKEKAKKDKEKEKQKTRKLKEKEKAKKDKEKAKKEKTKEKIQKKTNKKTKK